MKLLMRVAVASASRISRAASLFGEAPCEVGLSSVSTASNGVGMRRVARSADSGMQKAVLRIRRVGSADMYVKPEVVLTNSLHFALIGLLSSLLFNLGC
jgi:hypothetical protein